LTPFVWLAIFLVGILMLYRVAELEGIPGCAECGKPAPAALHHRCIANCSEPSAHHFYRAPRWPYALLSLGLIATMADAWFLR